MSRHKNPVTIARALVQGRVDNVLGDLTSWVEDESYDDLEEALLSELPEHCREDVMTLDEEVATFARIRDGLSPELQADLIRLNEWKDLICSVRQQAGSLVGLEMGRRIAGVR